MATYCIYDQASETYFARQYRPGRGWYSPHPEDARLYKTPMAAKRVIDADGHHVSYPGNRVLVIKGLTVTT